MLEGTTAFVTGASRGIGAEIAVAFSEAGANVALAARSDGIHEIADRIDRPDRTLPVRTDVTDEESVAAAIEETAATFGGLDCLVNNAGVSGLYGPVEEIDRADWEHVLAVNATGPVLCSKHAVPHLRESDRGRIVNIGSMRGKLPAELALPYAAAKMALIGMTRTLAFELGPDGVTVNTVCPGATAGDRIERVIEGRAEAMGVGFEEAKRRVYLEDTALGTLVDPEAIADLCVFLASERGRHVTAQDINVTAGRIWY